MQDSARVHILESSQNLIEEELDVLVAQSLVGLNDLRQICLHEVSHYVQLVEFSQRLWL